MCGLKTVEVPTKPYSGQIPGTSGLRKPVKTFQQKNYTENFVQSIFSYVGESLEKTTLILGGDGRFFCKEAAEIIVRMSAANKVGRVIVGKNAILSTPAGSNLIRKYNAVGGILLTASHNPGGPDKDFGIKFNTSNGGPATTNVTNAIRSITEKIQSYKTVPELQCDLSRVAASIYEIDTNTKFEIQVIDPVEDYVHLMQEIFDFKLIGELISGSSGGKPFRILVDCMHGVTGPYAKAIFERLLKVDEGCVINSVPLEDFGQGHPDPNLAHATELIQKLKTGPYDLGAAFDGDGDRNMILGEKAFFVSPSDSLAILAAHLHTIPYFKKNGVSGVARSMPTSRALDRVAKDLKLPVYEVPTGWKFFCNLFDDKKISFCGEESFGTGSNHIREKDGIWAILAWLSTIAHLKTSVQKIAENHWSKYGRDYYVRHDYEDLDSEVGSKILANIEQRVASANPPFSWKIDGHQVSVLKVNNFSYTDPVDHSTVTNQGIIVTLSNDARVIFRLSGTGSSGATVRIYMERYLPDWTLNKDDVIEPLVQVYCDVSGIKVLSGKSGPTVIT